MLLDSDPACILSIAGAKWNFHLVGNSGLLTNVFSLSWHKKLKYFVGVFFLLMEKDFSSYNLKRDALKYLKTNTGPSKLHPCLTILQFRWLPSPGVYFTLHNILGQLCQRGLACRGATIAENGNKRFLQYTSSPTAHATLSGRIRT